MPNTYFGSVYFEDAIWPDDSYSNFVQAKKAELAADSLFEKWKEFVHPLEFEDKVKVSIVISEVTQTENNSNLNPFSFTFYYWYNPDGT